MCVSVVCVCAWGFERGAVAHWPNNSPSTQPAPKNTPLWPPLMLHLCSTLQKLRHFLVLLSNRPMGKHTRSTIEFHSQQRVCSDCSSLARRKTTTKAEERGNIPVECGCLVHFSMTGNDDVCVFVWFPQQAATKSNPALAYFRAVYTKRHKAIKYKKVFKKTTATIKRQTDFGINVHPLSSSNKQ